MPKKRLRGYTLIELMITLIIVAILFSGGYFYLYGYLPKARLNQTTYKIFNLLKIVQSNAMRGNYRYGVAFKCIGAPTCEEYYACSFVDSNLAGDGGVDWACDNCDACAAGCSCSDNIEMNGQPGIKFKDDIRYLDDCSALAVPGDGTMAQIVFDKKGLVYRLQGGEPVLQDFEIFLASEHAERVREIEVTSGGLIDVVKLNKAGNFPGQANVGNCAYDK